jgi:predicted RNase H-like HicB family nuclease
MRNEFTAIIERDADWFIAYSPEVAGANGQGRTRAEALENLAGAIALILEDRREDGLRGTPTDITRARRDGYLPSERHRNHAARKH